MIAKKIYYCWFGKGHKSHFEKACIDSWYKKCSGYEIIEINEDNFDININDYCRQAYEHGNYSFVADVARMEILKNNSGFYLDTDIMLLKSLDELRKYKAIVPLNGKGFYNNAPLGCDTFVALYEEAYDKLEEGKCLNSLLNKCCYDRYDLLGRDLEIYDDIAFLGNEYFVTPGYHKTNKTIGIHYCLGFWLDKWQGGYDKTATFKAFVVYQNGVRDLKTEDKYYKNNPRIGNLYTRNTPMTHDIVFYGNYFYNPRVARVYNDRFCFERFGNYVPEDLESFQVEDVVIQCMKLE